MPRTQLLSASRQLQQITSRRSFASKPNAATKRAFAKPPPPPPSLKPKPPTNPPPAPRTAPPTAPRFTPTSASSVTSFAAQLGAKGAPTILYEAPSHTWYMIGSVGTGAFFFVYAAWNYWDVMLNPREGLALWVKYAFAAIVLTCGAVGAHFALGSLGIISSIRAVPSKIVKSKGGAAAKAAASTPIMIEVATRRPVPFMSAKKRLVRPEQVELPFRMTGLFGGEGAVGQVRSKTLSASEQLAELERKKGLKEYNRQHPVTAPWYHMSKWAVGSWFGLRRAFTKEGFAKVKVGDATLKLDVTGGWVLDGGRAMDRLVVVKRMAKERDQGTGGRLTTLQ